MIARLWLPAVALMAGCASPSPAPSGGTDAQRDERAAKIQHLVVELGEGADPLHGEISPAALELADYGIAIIPYLRVPLSSSQLGTRLHAQTALSTMVGRLCGFVPGRGWTQDGGKARSQALWARNGSYDAAAPPEARAASIAAWMRWHADHVGPGAPDPCGVKPPEDP